MPVQPSADRLAVVAEDPQGPVVGVDRQGDLAAGAQAGEIRSIEGLEANPVEADQAPHGGDPEDAVRSAGDVHGVVHG